MTEQAAYVREHVTMVESFELFALTFMKAPLVT